MKNALKEKIINTLLTICIVAGFTGFAFFILPDNIKKAGALPPQEGTSKTPTRLSDIIPLDEPNPATAKSHDVKGSVSRFSPSPLPPSPFDERAADTGIDAGDEDSLVAGGAGAAIDDSSAEARLTLAYQSKRPPRMKGVQDETGEETSDSSSKDLKVYPLSSLGRREPSPLDHQTLRKGKEWIMTPAGLEADVAFWRDIYTKYNKTSVVLHHPRHLGIVYDVVDLSDIDSDVRLSDIEKARMRENRVEKRRDEVTETLLKLSENPPASSLGDEELRIKKLFQGITESRMFRRAAIDDGVRAQTGQSDKFIAGLKYSGKYLGEIEAIFESLGLPRELTRLIFVESMFNPRAISSAGASGIWQFMPGTGRLYLSITSITDERNDPITATRAAAKLLMHNFEKLGSWPLAINAYNTGPGRIAQATAQMGTTDIARIIRGFNHPAYGFASRNFFLEFLAALDVAEHAEKYFGPIEYDPPLRFEPVAANYNLSLPQVARIAGIDIDELLSMNPGLTPAIASGSKLLPIGYMLRIPPKRGELFLAAAARAPRSKAGGVLHVVEDGESLATIAKMYGVTPQSILKSNEMTRTVHIGQTLRIPVDQKR